MEKLRTKGIRIPEDVAVVGFDGYPDVEHEGICLSTYRNDGKILAHISVNTLLRRIEGRRPAGSTDHRRYWLSREVQWKTGGRCDMPEVKLKDIADEIGVSTVTVSNALSGKKGVSDGMRSRIEAVARKMGYNVDRYTRKEEGGFRVGVLVADIYIEVGNSFYWALYQQLAYAASKSQSVTMLEVLDSELQRSKELPRMLQGESCGRYDYHRMAFPPVY